MNTLSLVTVASYNASANSNCVRFQNNDGSLRKFGFVVTNGSNAAYFRNIKAAQAFMKAPIFTNNITPQDFNA